MTITQSMGGPPMGGATEGPSMRAPSIGGASAAAVSANLLHAYLRIMQPTDKGGGSRIGEITFQFNPKEYTLQKQARWKKNTARNARHASMPEFEGAEPATVTLELFLDATLAGTDPESRKAGSPETLEKKIKLLFSCVRPVDADAKHASAPMVLFGWGGKAEILSAVVTQVSVKYTLFMPDGTPVRALCTIALQEVPTDPPFQNPTSGGLDIVRSHTVAAGDSLPSIATAEYGHPRFWRALATANNIDDPMRVPVGRTLLLPPEDQAGALS